MLLFYNSKQFIYIFFADRQNFINFFSEQILTLLITV